MGAIAGVSHKMLRNTIKDCVVKCTYIGIKWSFTHVKWLIIKVNLCFYIFLVAFYSNQSLTLFVMEKNDFLSVIVASTNDHLISFQVRRKKHGDQYHKGLFGFILLLAFLLFPIYHIYRCRCDQSRLVLLKTLKTSWNYCKNYAPYPNHLNPTIQNQVYHFWNAGI